jgi:hypothetical protein
LEILEGNLISISYFRGKLEELYHIENQLTAKKALSRNTCDNIRIVFEDIIVEVEVHSENSLVGTFFPTVISMEPREPILSLAFLLGAFFNSNPISIRYDSGSLSSLWI